MIVPRRHAAVNIGRGFGCLKWQTQITVGNHESGATITDKKEGK
jgi:hypothetical protein